MKEDYQNQQLSKYESAAKEYSKETNLVFRVISRQMILIATVFLSLSFFIFNIENIDAFLDLNFWFINLKWWFLIGWFSLCFSIIAGLFQFLVDYYYFKDIMEEILKIRNKIFEESLSSSELEDYVIKVQNRKKEESSSIPVKLQGFLLILGIIIITTSVSFILLKM